MRLRGRPRRWSVTILIGLGIVVSLWDRNWYSAMGWGLATLLAYTIESNRWAE
jgi:hypothetical protein